MAERPGIMFYFNDWTPLLKLDDSTLVSLFRAAIRYGATGEAADFEGTNAILWEMIVSRIDRDADRYEARKVSGEYAVYCRETKRKGEEPLPFEVWNEQRSISNDNDSIQLQPQPQKQYHPQEYLQGQGQGEKQGNQRGAEGGRDFPTPYKPPPEDTFEKQREEGLAKLEERMRERTASPYSSYDTPTRGYGFPEEQSLSR